MLDIPQSIKDRFKTDGILKNVRVSFPGGEYPDICNDRIIKESLKFDESISSREEITFGLCESSQVSFECVDVPNIKGLQIDVDIEIDATDAAPDTMHPGVNEPVIICATPRGQTEELIFVICDFPLQEPGTNYTSQDGTYIYWNYPTGEYAGRLDTNIGGMMPKLSYYREVTGVDPRGNYTDIYDGYHGGGYRRTYLYSVTTGKFYEQEIMTFSWTDDQMPLSTFISNGFEDDAFLDAIKHIDFDPEINRYYFPIDIHTSPDVPFPFYKVPLGRFIVDEAKRNAGMNIRKIVAYAGFTNLALSPMNRWLLGTSTSVAVDVNALNYIVANNSFRFVDNAFVYTDMTADFLHDTDPYQVTGLTYQRVGSYQEYTVKFFANKFYEYDYTGYTAYPTGERLCRLDKYDVRSDLDAVILDYATRAAAQISGVTVGNDEVFADIYRVLKNLCYFSSFAGAVVNYNTRSDVDEAKDRLFILPGDYFIPGDKIRMIEDLKIQVFDFSGTVMWERTILSIISSGDFGVSAVQTPYNLTMHFIPNEDTFPNVYEEVADLDMRKVLESCCELYGAFGKANRQGLFEFLAIPKIELDGLFPDHDIYPSEELYPEAHTAIEADAPGLAVIEADCVTGQWYEEYYIRFGGLICEFANNEVLDTDGNPVKMIYSTHWGDGTEPLIYNASSNLVLGNNSYTLAQLKAALEPLIKALKEIDFYPSDFSCVGLPYIEAGDYALASYHGNQVLNLVLSRTLDGIQALRDKMKSD